MVAEFQQARVVPQVEKELARASAEARRRANRDPHFRPGTVSADDALDYYFAEVRREQNATRMKTVAEHLNL